LKISLDFVWTSTLSPIRIDEPVKYHLSNVFPEELAHVLFIMAICHLLQAKTIAEEANDEESKLRAKLMSSPSYDPKADPDPKLDKGQIESIEGKRNEAAKLCRIAAGIFTHLLKTVLPTLTERQSVNRAPDILPATCETLSMMCLAIASELAVYNAVTKGMSENLIAKLCLSVADRYAACRMILGRGLGAIFHSLDQSWNIFMHGKVHIYNARARKYLAKAKQKESVHGAAVAYLSAAVSVLEENKIPNLSPALHDITKELTEDHRQLVKLLEVATRDNEKVYFALVPKVSELVIPEKSKLNLSDIPFQSPQFLTVAFFDNNTQSPNTQPQPPTQPPASP